MFLTATHVPQWIEELHLKDIYLKYHLDSISPVWWGLIGAGIVAFFILAILFVSDGDDGPFYR